MCVLFNPIQYEKTKPEMVAMAPLIPIMGLTKEDSNSNHANVLLSAKNN
jgi:hypothetical protein